MLPVKVLSKILGMIFKTEIVKSIYYRHSCIPTCSNNIQQPGAHPYIFFLLTCISLIFHRGKT